MAALHEDLYRDQLFGLIDLPPGRLASLKYRARHRFTRLLAYELRQTVATDEDFKDQWPRLVQCMPALELSETYSPEDVDREDV